MNGEAPGPAIPGARGADGRTAEDGRAAGSWIAPLLERYRRVVGSADADADLVEAFNTLRLADALRDKAALARERPDHPVQLALLGPTQSGKSTLANLLLDTEAAGVSALAGYTVHATGLASGCEETELDALATVLAPLRRVPRAALDRDALDAFALENVAAGPEAMLERAVVWDTPDFDSVEAGGYRGAVLQGAAIGDVLVLVASKDKYGDRSVWDMLELLHALGRPLLVCLNKLGPDDSETVVRAFSERFVERLGTTLPPLVTLPFVRGVPGGGDATPLPPPAALARLREAVAEAVARVDRQTQRTALEAFVERHRARWLAPLEDELAAATEWRRLVDAAIEEAEAEYVRRYLDDPRKYDTFNRALAELLTLLELPGIARTLARTREVVTWPARTLLGLGRRRLGVERAAAPDQEAEVLDGVLERVLTRLQGELIERREAEDGRAAWWRAAQAAFRARRATLERDYGARGEAVRTAFEPRIEEAARRLHERLREQPALLATLRAARATTDAAGVALAVKSGGLAPADLVLAPAMLSVTTLLTESALGRYLDTVRRELQAEQRALVRRELLDGVLGASLRALPEALDDDALLSGGPDAATLVAARPAAA